MNSPSYRRRDGGSGASRVGFGASMNSPSYRRRDATRLPGFGGRETEASMNSPSYRRRDHTLDNFLHSGTVSLYELAFIQKARHLTLTLLARLLPPL